MSSDDEYYYNENPTVLFGKLPQHYRLLEGPVVIKISEDVCVQEYLFHRFKNAAFAKYVEGDDIFIADDNGIWVQVKVERIKSSPQNNSATAAEKKTMSKLCKCLRLFFCICEPEDEAFEAFVDSTNDDAGYEADDEDRGEFIRCPFKPINYLQVEWYLDYLEELVDRGCEDHRRIQYLTERFMDEF